MSTTEFDYIVVGAGSSGSVLASQLSADPAVRVLLVEGGPQDRNPLIDMPRGVGKLLAPRGPYVWDYDALASPGGRQEHWFTGKTLGGGSSVNGMIYMRGHPDDYDAWERAGCTGWGWTDMGRCFKALENHELGAGPWRGDRGPLRVSMHPQGDPLCEAIIQAGQELGLDRVADVNESLDGGIGYQPRTIFQGQRHSAAKAFLRPVLNRPNLSVLTHTQALRLLFSGTRACGVVLQDATGTREVQARRDIVLCAGALQSPQLLQRSGVGPAELLQRLGIPVVANLPQVGHNLRDHRYISMQYRVREGSLNAQFSGWRLIGQLARYFLQRSGAMTHAVHEVSAMVKTRPGLSRPDAQLGIGLYSIVATDKGLAIENYPGITFGGYFAQPRSQGQIMITSAEPDTPPDILANYLSAPEDRAAAIALVHYIRRLASQPALRQFIVSETLPGVDVASDEAILQAFFRQPGSSTTYHYAGTCRMGVDDGAVVDPQLRVRGVQGLRVADASVMPTLISGNTNGPCMALGLRAAEIIAGRAT